MLFSGDDVYKPVRVLSGGEGSPDAGAHDAVRLERARHRPADQPTSIWNPSPQSTTAFVISKGTVLFWLPTTTSSVQTIATRIIEIREKGVLDKECTYDEFLEFRETYIRADAGALSAWSERPARAADTGCVGICLGAAVRLELSIKYLTGVPCPGCGLSRALAALLRLDFRTALRFSPDGFRAARRSFCTRCLVKAASRLQKPRAHAVEIIVLDIAIWLIRLALP